MAQSDKSITELDVGTLTEGSLFPVADVNAVTSYVSAKHSASVLGEGMCGKFEYQALTTGNKTIFGAINELNSIVAATPITGTLEAGQTSITISDPSITTDSLIDVFVDIDSVSYNSMAIANGSVTLTFDAQSSNMGVAILVRGGSSIHEQKSYIYNVGSCGFNTGYTHNANTKVRMKAIFPPVSWFGNNYQNTFGARNSSHRSNAFGFFHRFNGICFCGYRTGSETAGDNADAAISSTSSAFYNVPVILEATGNSFSWYSEDDASTVHSITSSGTADSGVSPIGIFCGNGSTNGGWNPYDNAMMTLYWFEIYENDTLVHRFIPAHNNNQYCLYDEVDHIYIYDVVNSGNYVRGFIPR